jgi:hypothetical protein
MLLRVWHERSDDPPNHAHLSLESVTGMRREFASPDALARYLSDFITTMDLEAAAEALDEPRA